MIKYNENNINEWYFSDDNIVKVYRNEDVIYQKIASGSTPPSPSGHSLPDVPFSINYNAKNYDNSTHTLLKTDGQLVNQDAEIQYVGTAPTYHDTYLTISTGSKAQLEGNGYFVRDNNNPNLTIISKQKTDYTRDCHLFANRDIEYNWMYRVYTNKLTLHGDGGEFSGLAVTSQPVIESVRVDSNRNLTYNNYTDNTTSSYSNFSYGLLNDKAALFAGYYDDMSESFAGDFYWIYMTQNTLTDEQIQQVIDYNENL